MNSPDKFVAAEALGMGSADVGAEAFKLVGVAADKPLAEPMDESPGIPPRQLQLFKQKAAKTQVGRRVLMFLAALLAATSVWWFNADAPGKTDWANETVNQTVNQTVREVRLNPTSLIASSAEPKSLGAVLPESLLKREPRRSSPDEARLLEVYGLLASGDGDQALQKAQRLASDAPGFALAQLLYADLLTAQLQPAAGFGAAGGAMVTAGRERLDELTDEARVRVRAAAIAPATGLVPSALVSLAANVKHAVAVDVSRSRLYVFENTSQGLSLIREYYASIGKNGMVKQISGDQRTPLGVYFVTKQIPSATLPARYGKQALALNYPNPYDRLQGRTGDGIWLHGIPPGMYSRAPWATDGCIALANHYLQELSAYIDVQATPIVVAERLEWVKPAELTARHAAFLAQFANWKAASKQADLQANAGFYSTSVNLPEAEALGPPWREQLREEQQRRAQRAPIAEAAIDHLSIISWQDREAVMVVTFSESEPGDKRSRTRRQYWIQEPAGWRIFYERALS